MPDDVTPHSYLRRGSAFVGESLFAGVVLLVSCASLFASYGLDKLTNMVGHVLSIQKIDALRDQIGQVDSIEHHFYLEPRELPKPPPLTP